MLHTNLDTVAKHTYKTAVLSIKEKPVETQFQEQKVQTNVLHNKYNLLLA